jgi:DNA-binding transcriptional regulator YdaS (Cro superfamily)
MEALKRAIKELGSAKALATAINVKPATVSQWLTAVRPLPIERCFEIERATKGLVTCEALRPDIDWTRAAAPVKEAA